MLKQPFPKDPRPMEAKGSPGVGFQHPFIEKQQGIECPRLSARRDLTRTGQVIEEGHDLGLAHLRRMALAVEEDKTADPEGVGSSVRGEKWLRRQTRRT